MNITHISEVELSVDSQPVTLADFIESNVIEEPQISVEELSAVLNLKVGRTVCLGLVDVTRIK